MLRSLDNLGDMVAQVQTAIGSAEEEMVLLGGKMDRAEDVIYRATIQYLSEEAVKASQTISGEVMCNDKTNQITGSTIENSGGI